MNVMPAYIARLPNLLTQQIMLGGISRTNVGLLDVQTQLSTGKRVNRTSDDPVRASAITVLDQRLATAEQRGRNLQHAQAVIDTLDSTLGEASDLVQQARTIASSQIGLGSDATTRRQQAVVVDSLLQQLQTIANRSTAGVYLFGGSTPNSAPVQQNTNGFRYTARGSGLLTDLGTGDRIPITIGGNTAIGETSARQRSLIDLNPSLTASTSVADLRGARGLGVSLGVVNFQFTGGPAGSVNLSQCASVGDVVNTITASIRQYETANSVTILGPGGVSFSGGSLRIDVAPAAGPPQLTFSDPLGGTTALDLGLANVSFSNGPVSGTDANPKLTPQTPLSAIPSLTLPLGSIRLRQTRGDTFTVRDVDLSAATTIDDLRNLIESAGVGARLEVNDDGTGLNILNEVAGPRLSVEEIAGNNNTATQLGIRTISTQTPLADFNAGSGVRIVDNVSDPVTGLPSPALSSDMRITLGNGQAFDVDLRPQDLASVQTLLARINQEFTNAIALPPVNASAPALAAGQFTAALNPTTNAIAFTQTVGPAPLSVAKLNNSAAAEDLGLMNGTYDAPSATLIAQDRTAIRVDNLFSDLIDLREALLKDDSAGITVAGSRLEASFDRVIAANALVGTFGRRTKEASDRLDDQTVLDTKLKSDLQDVDFAEAASRFSLLQTQLQAALQTAGQFQNRSLLDFLR
jgi:flagellin-like hook-associated protein FlgL